MNSHKSHMSTGYSSVIKGNEKAFRYPIRPEPIMRSQSTIKEQHKGQSGSDQVQEFLAEHSTLSQAKTAPVSANRPSARQPQKT